MKLETIVAVSGAAVLWYAIFRSRPYAACHICGMSKLVCESCEECGKVACSDHAPLYRVCEKCMKEVQDAVRTSTTGTIAGYRIASVIGVVAGSASDSRNAIFRIQAEAKRRGANGVVDVRLQPMATSKHFMGYSIQGTAVTLEPETPRGSAA